MGRGSKSMWRRFAGLSAALQLLSALLLAPLPAMASGDPMASGMLTRLTVVSTLQRENMRPFKEAFEAENPDIRLTMRTLGNGTVTDALMAQAEVADGIDVIWGLSAASMILLRDAGLLLPYTPSGAERVEVRFKDARVPAVWVGGGIWTTALCAATGLGDRLPAAWSDLTHPSWRGRIAMPSPVSSGVGMALVGGWLLSMGEERAWAFMDALHENMVVYTQEGSKACRMVSTGAIDIGLSFDYRATHTKAQTKAVVPVFPDGLGWDVSAAAILTTTKNADAARRFADWSASDRARRFYADALDFSMVASGEVNRELPDLPPDLAKRLAPMDFTWLAANRERIIATWIKRYGTKMEAPAAE